MAKNNKQDPCVGCNNVKGCINCVGGSERAVITEIKQDFTQSGENEQGLTEFERALYIVIVNYEYTRNRDEYIKRMAKCLREKLTLGVDIFGMINSKITWDNKARKYYRKGIEDTLEKIKN